MLLRLKASFMAVPLKAISHSLNALCVPNSGALPGLELRPASGPSDERYALQRVCERGRLDFGIASSEAALAGNGQTIRTMSADWTADQKIGLVVHWNSMANSLG